MLKFKGYGSIKYDFDISLLEVLENLLGSKNEEVDYTDIKKTGADAFSDNQELERAQSDKIKRRWPIHVFPGPIYFLANRQDTGEEMPAAALQVVESASQRICD
jgi:hypothetical protein